MSIMQRMITAVDRLLGGQPKDVRSNSLENPTTPLSAPADWLFETLSGGFGLDGQLWVNEHTAMQLSTVRACVRAISEDVGTVPLHLYLKDSKGNKRLADNRVEYQLLRRRPNPHMTACVFRQVMTANCLLLGNAYAEIEYNGAGKITNLWPLYPSFVKQELTANKTLRYICTNPMTGQNRVILSDDMLHLKDMSLDGYTGLYTIRHLKEAVGLGLALQNFGLYYFLNGSRPGGVLEVAGTLTPEAQERLRSSWANMYSGPRNTNKVAILEQGMKFNPVAINNDNAQYVESRKLQADEIARIFRVPPHKIGILERSTNNNIEHQGLEYVTDCLRPWFVRWEEELDVKMFPSQPEYMFKHDEDGLQRGDFASRMEGYSKGRQWGWMSANDIRRSDNMNPIGPEGDIYLSPLNMIPADKAGDVPVGGAPAAPNPSKGGDIVPISSEGRELSKEQISGFTSGLFEDAMRRALHYDNNAQLRKSVSQAFVKVIALIAQMRGMNGNSESAARAYADEMYQRRDAWKSKALDEAVREEFDLAFAAMEKKESTQ